jgi:hypothetical protein
LDPDYGISGHGLQAIIQQHSTPVITSVIGELSTDDNSITNPNGILPLPIALQAALLTTDISISSSETTAGSK